MRHAIVVITALLALAGCSASNDGPAGMHKVAWYKAHPKATAKEVKWCSNNVPRQKLAACLNAYAASSQQATKQFFAQPSTPFTGGGTTVGKGGWTP